MEGTHHTLLQLVENAARLIGVISQHAQKARLTGKVGKATSTFVK